MDSSVEDVRLAERVGGGTARPLSREERRRAAPPAAGTIPVHAAPGSMLCPWDAWVPRGVPRGRASPCGTCHLSFRVECTLSPLSWNTSSMGLFVTSTFAWEPGCRAPRSPRGSAALAACPRPRPASRRATTKATSASRKLCAKWPAGMQFLRASARLSRMRGLGTRVAEEVTCARDGGHVGGGA